MDPRKKIFSFWTQKCHTKLQTYVRERSDGTGMENVRGHLIRKSYKCGSCKKDKIIGSHDLLWIISENPEKYLLEGESIICAPCAAHAAKNRRQFTCHGGETRPPYGRYIYNQHHDYYTLIECAEREMYSGYRSSSVFDVKQREKILKNNPFFQIDNTLFAILYRTLEFG